MVSQLEATIKADQAAIDSVKVQLDYTTIKSPIDGRVGIRQVDQGNMMTTMAALLGALPLALQEGTGSELRRPLGISIVGGLLLSQLITLYTTPVVYLYLDRLGHWIHRKHPETISEVGTATAQEQARPSAS